MWEMLKNEQKKEPNEKKVELFLELSSNQMKIPMFIDIYLRFGEGGRLQIEVDTKKPTRNYKIDPKEIIESFFEQYDIYLVDINDPFNEKSVRFYVREEEDGRYILEPYYRGRENKFLEKKDLKQYVLVIEGELQKIEITYGKIQENEGKKEFKLDEENYSVGERHEKKNTFEEKWKKVEKKQKIEDIMDFYEIGEFKELKQDLEKLLIDEEGEMKNLYELHFLISVLTSLGIRNLIKKVMEDERVPQEIKEFTRESIIKEIKLVELNEDEIREVAKDAFELIFEIKNNFKKYYKEYLEEIKKQRNLLPPGIKIEHYAAVLAFYEVSKENEIIYKPESDPLVGIYSRAMDCDLTSQLFFELCAEVGITDLRYSIMYPKNKKTGHVAIKTESGYYIETTGIFGKDFVLENVFKNFYTYRLLGFEIEQERNLVQMYNRFFLFFKNLVDSQISQESIDEKIKKLEEMTNSPDLYQQLYSILLSKTIIKELNYMLEQTSKIEDSKEEKNRTIELEKKLEEVVTLTKKNPITNPTNKYYEDFKDVVEPELSGIIK